MSRKLYVGIFILLLFVAAGLFYRYIPSVELVQGAYSRTSVSGIEKILSSEKKGVEWSIIEDTKTSENDSRPPYHMLVISAEDYLDLGVKGNIHLYFFNDNLMKVVFFPIDYENYVVNLRNKLSIIKLEDRYISLNPILKVKSGIDYNGKFYISFSDIRLMREHTYWIDTYS